MALTKYTYSIEHDTLNGKVALGRLTEEISESSITVALDRIDTNGDVLDIWFKAALPTAEESVLTTVVHDHNGEPLEQNMPVAINDVAEGAEIYSRAKGFRILDGHLYFKKGIRVDCAPDGDTNVDVKFTKNMLLCGGGCRLGSNTQDGDYVEFFIVDKDNLLGYGADTVLAKFVETDFAWPEKDWEVLLEDAKEIPAGIYLRITYHSVETATESVVVYGWFTMRDAAGV